MMPATIEPADMLSQLNPEQREAVEAIDGPILVLAGAGTGKTRVLTTRIAHILLNKHAWPGEILAVTFTNKAAREMVERVQKLTGVSSGLWLGTFHSLCAKILRRHAEIIGLSSSFIILDTDDQLRLLKAILKERNIDDKAMPAKLVHAVIQKWKDKGLTPDKITSERDKHVLDGHGVSIYQLYQERLKANNAVDFGDLILQVLKLFEDNSDILKQYAQRFKYILVDEYQDTNVAQYIWLRLLATVHKNICCVGDDDQSIYSWRGAEVGNILKFEKDFPGAKIVRLECNYRSSKHILASASALIANNQGRFGKTLWTPGEEDGERVRLKSVWDEREEALYLSEEVEALHVNKHKLSEMAILVRAGFQTRAFEERFLTLGIAYKVIGGLRFYERAEIKDAVAYLRVVAEPRDDLAFERIVNVPKRGIGQATLQRMHSFARENHCSLFQATQALVAQGEFKGKMGGVLQQLLQYFERWREQLSVLPLSELLELVLEESGYRDMWRQEKSAEAQGRLENLRELGRAMGEFETVAAFLEHVGLVSDNQQEAGSEVVSLMTLHAAKGLEFDIVFLPGWEEGLFPHQKAIDESGSKGLEEERRLAYVGITRARKRLYILYAANRRIYNQWQSSIPSRFIAELPDAHIDVMDDSTTMRRFNASNWQNEVASILDTHTHEGANYTRGTRIFHQKFGYGRIESVSGKHLEITFEKAGRKKVMEDYVERV